MKYFPVLFLVVLIQLLTPAAALQLQDNLFFSLAPNETSCLTLTLPDDVGATDQGKQDYTITTTTDWADLTRQVVRTDENSTALIPICFSASGRLIGDCSAPYLITITSPTGSREWRGGVCAAAVADADTSSAPATTPGDVRTIIASTVDLFDAAFSSPHIQAQPSQPISLSILLQSPASLEYTITLQQPFSQSASAATHTPNPVTTNLTITAPTTPGEYQLRAVVQANCSSPSCTKTASAILVVGPDTDSFDLSLFPSNLNVRSTAPVPYRLTIHNRGTTRTIALTPRFPDTVNTDFFGDAVTLEAGASHILTFSVTPPPGPSTSTFVVSATSQNLQKEAHATLSVDELLAGARLLAEDKPTLQDFEISYPTLSDTDLSLDTLTIPPNPTTEPTFTPLPEPPVQSPPQPTDFTLPYLLILAAAGIVVLFLLFHYYKVSSGDKPEEW